MFPSLLCVTDWWGRCVFPHQWKQEEAHYKQNIQEEHQNVASFKKSCDYYFNIVIQKRCLWNAKVNIVKGLSYFNLSWCDIGDIILVYRVYRDIDILICITTRTLQTK